MVRSLALLTDFFVHEKDCYATYTRHSVSILIQICKELGVIDHLTACPAPGVDAFRDAVKDAGSLRQGHQPREICSMRCWSNPTETERERQCVMLEWEFLLERPARFLDVLSTGTENILRSESADFVSATKSLHPINGHLMRNVRRSSKPFAFWKEGRHKKKKKGRKTHGAHQSSLWVT